MEELILSTYIGDAQHRAKTIWGAFAKILEFAKTPQINDLQRKFSQRAWVKISTAIIL